MGEFEAEIERKAYQEATITNTHWNAQTKKFKNRAENDIYNTLFENKKIPQPQLLPFIRESSRFYRYFADNEEDEQINEIFKIMNELASSQSSDKTRQAAAIVFSWVLFEIGVADNYRVQGEEKFQSFFDFRITINKKFPKDLFKNILTFIVRYLPKAAKNDRDLLLKNFSIITTGQGNSLQLWWPAKDKDSKKEQKVDEKLSETQDIPESETNQISLSNANTDDKKEEKKKKWQKEIEDQQKFTRLLVAPGVLSTYLRRFLFPFYFVMGIRIQKNAVVALAEGLQNAALKLFQFAFLAAVHRKRVTVHSRDCVLASRLMDRKTRFNLSNNQKTESWQQRENVRNQNQNFTYIVRAIRPGNFRKLLRRSGIKRIHAEAREWFEFWAQAWLTVMLSRALIYRDSRRKKTISTLDVIYGMKYEGVHVYAFDTFDLFPRNIFK